MKKIVSLLFAAALCLSLTGCVKKPDSTVKAFCEALKKMDTEKMESLVPDAEAADEAAEGLDEIEDNRELREIMKIAASRMEYEISEVKTQKKEAQAKVSFDFIDASEVVRKVTEEYLLQALTAAFSGEEPDAEALMKLFADAGKEFAKQNEVPRTTSEVVFNLTKTGDGWKIREIPAEVYNVMLCNAVECIREIGGMFEGAED